MRKRKNSTYKIIKKEKNDINTDDTIITNRSKNSKILNFSNIISSVSLITSIISVFIGYKIYISNQNYNRDVFSMNNVPDLEVVQIAPIYSEDAKKYNLIDVPNSSLYGILFKNNSRSTIRHVITESVFASTDKFILRRLNGDMSGVNSYNPSNFNRFIYPAETDSSYVPFFLNIPDTIAVDTNFNVHIKFIFWSDKNIIFDKYLIFSIKKVDSILTEEVVGFTEWEKKGTKEKPLTNEEIMENIMKEKMIVNKTGNTHRNIYRKLIDTHIYLTDEMIYLEYLNDVFK
jgi:hypothetical protein